MAWRFEGKFATSEVMHVPPIISFRLFFPAKILHRLLENNVDMVLMRATGFWHQQFIRAKLTEKRMNLDYRKDQTVQGALAVVGGEAPSDDSGLVFAKDADDTDLNPYAIRGNHDRGHFQSCRLQPYLAGAL